MGQTSALFIAILPFFLLMKFHWVTSKVTMAGWLFDMFKWQNSCQGPRSIGQQLR